MRKLILALVASAMIAPAAMARDEVKSYSYSTSESRLLDLNPSVAPIPLSVEIKVIGKRIHHVIELSREELDKRVINNNYKQTIENLRSYAVFIASGVYDCDLIVAARFKFEVTDKGGVIEMYGYPANFVNWGGKGENLPPAKQVNLNYGKEQ